MSDVFGDREVEVYRNGQLVGRPQVIVTDSEDERIADTESESGYVLEVFTRTTTMPNSFGNPAISQVALRLDGHEIRPFRFWAFYIDEPLPQRFIEASFPRGVYSDVGRSGRVEQPPEYEVRVIAIVEPD